MRFSIVTPCLDPGPLLGETIRSVLEQDAVRDGRVELDYVVVDGGSTDGTVEYLRSLGDRVRWVSEPDSGMYDALVKGLEEAPGDVHCYLNAGDLYHPRAFDVVAEVLPRTGGWLTGMQVAQDAAGTVVRARVPFAFRRGWFRHRVYDGVTMDFLQQESTFWAGALTRTVDLERLRSFRLAGDAFLWAELSRVAELHVVGAHLGAWRDHPGHLAADLDAYRREQAAFTAPVPPRLRPLLRWDVLMDRYATDAQRQTYGRGLVWLWRGGWTNEPEYPPRRAARLARRLRRLVPASLRAPTD